MKIVFMGTPDFAVPSLEKLIEKHKVELIITQPDRPNRRGKKISFTPVKEIGLKNDIEIYQPKNLKGIDTIKKLKKINADVFIVIAYGQILSEEILQIPTYGCLNVHGSILPKYRGAAPIHYAVKNGDEETGVTIMYMDKGLDTGDIIKIGKMSISAKQNTGDVHDEMMELGSEVLLEVLEEIENGTVKRVKQNDEKATFTSKISKEEGHINFNKTSEEVLNLVRGMTPYPSAYTILNDKKYKIGEVEIVDDVELKTIEATNNSKTNGEIIKSEEEIIVKCKGGGIRVKKIQKPGSKMMLVKDFLRGNKIEKGTVLI